ncbi:MAG: glycosyltransferase family 4 protein [Acidimicrobiales bacterium]
MKILLFSQKLIYSGANIVAVDLATKIRDQSHEVIVYGTRGPMEEALVERGIPYHPMSYDQQLNVRWPSLRVARELRKLVADEGVDLVHTYEWPACLEALLGPYRSDGVPLVASVMSMRIERFMPRSLPTIVGTRVLRDQLARSKFSSVTFIPPSVDVDHDSPEFDQGTFRKEAGIDEQTMLVAIVSRLSAMKMESMRQTMDAVADLSANNDIRLVIVGGGRLEEVIREKANGLNERMGREVISLTGSLGDPRPVYAAADVVVGMGSSALRGLAFAKPVIVVGDNGYVELFTPETSGEFLVQGFWGLGEGDGVERLTYQLQSLNDDAERREILGAFGRKFACDRFSLVKQADALAEVYKQALEKPPQPADRRSEVTRTVARLMADRGLGFVRRRFTS